MVICYNSSSKLIEPVVQFNKVPRALTRQRRGLGAVWVKKCCAGAYPLVGEADMDTACKVGWQAPPRTLPTSLYVFSKGPLPPPKSDL